MFNKISQNHKWVRVAQNNYSYFCSSLFQNSTQFWSDISSHVSLSHLARIWRVDRFLSPMRSSSLIFLGSLSWLCISKTSLILNLERQKKSGRKNKTKQHNYACYQYTKWLENWIDMEKSSKICGYSNIAQTRWPTVWIIHWGFSYD